MRLLFALPASALLLTISAVAWVRAPHPSHSPRRLVARAGIGAFEAIVGAGDRRVAPEATLSPAPLTLSASRPDAVGPGPAADEVAAVERYHEFAIETARAKSALVVVGDAPGAAVKTLAVAEFEKKCEQAAGATTKKHKSTKAALDIPIVSCCVRRATAMLVS